MMTMWRRYHKLILMSHFLKVSSLSYSNTFFRIATVMQLITEKLPEGARMSNSSKDLLYVLTMSFLTNLAAKSNLACSNKNKKTIFPEHVIDALAVSDKYPIILTSCVIGILTPKVSWQDL